MYKPNQCSYAMHLLICFVLILFGLTAVSVYAQSPHLYGIHDADPSPQDFLDHLNTGAVNGWVTATVAVGDNPDDHGGSDFTAISDQGHTVICRLNYGYSPNGTLPAADRYDEFAQRCANFVAATQGCAIFIIGNETNLAHEWPVVSGRHQYISPQDYAGCFNQCYNAIKAVAPEAQVVPQALAPFAGPYSEGDINGTPHDGNPLNWVDYMNQMLTAIESSGELDGIALHINSRGYTYDDIHSTQKVNAAGQDLYFSFYVYKDWINHGIPSNLHDLPLYATECNGIYYWKGGHPENPESHYESGWIQEIYAEIDRYNQQAMTDGTPLFRCVNLYRWCQWCDDWNIDGNSYESQMLADLDQVVTYKYSWTTENEPPPASELVNGDFENGEQANGVGNGWSSFQSTGYPALFEVQSDQVAEGSWSQKIICPQPQSNYKYAGVYQTITVTAGQTYEIQASNRTQFDGGAAWDYIARLGVDLTGGSNFQSSDITWYEFNSQKDVWHTLNQSATATHNSMTIFLQTWRKWPADGESYAWFDNVSISPAAGQNAPPVAAFEANPVMGNVPLTVNFDASASSDPDGDALLYSWEFGNGETATGINTSCTYQNAGTYTVLLSVDDQNGHTDTEQTTLEVTESNDNLIVNGEFNDLNGWTLWLERGNLSPVIDSGRAWLKSQEHNGGLYQQFNTGGAGSQLSVSGFWQSDPVLQDYQWAEVLIINSDRLPVDGEDIYVGLSDVVMLYKNDTWNTPQGWSGRMSDTAPVSNISSFTAAADQATIVLKSGNLGQALSGCLFDNIVVSPSGSSPGNQFPTAHFTATPQSGRAPLAVTLDASASSDPDGDALTFSWNFGDGNQGTGSQCVHTYQSAGSYSITLTVNDGHGGTDQSSLLIAVTQPTTGPLDFAAIRDSLNQIGLDLQFVKTGFHTAVGGNARGIGDYMATLDEAGVPFCIKSVDEAGIILEGAMMRENSGVPHQLIYRRCGDYNGYWMDCPDYNKTPYDAAVEHWQYHMDAFPPELLAYKHLIWIETVNELNRLASDWIGEFCYHTAQMAMAEGFRWAGPSWSTGVPEYEHWIEPGMIQFLQLVADNPDRISVALHEYSLSRDNLDNMYPHLVGRFQMLYQICDSLNIDRPKIHITEFGWDGVSVGHTIDQAMNIDIPWAAELYGSYRNVLSAAIWYLGPGFGGVADQAQQLIAPMTEYATRNYFVIPLEDNNVNRPPVAALNAYPKQGVAPLTVNFDASGSSDPDQDPLSYIWDFGDQSSGTGQTVTHRFEQQGTYTVTLTVNDGNSHSDSSQVQIHVQDQVNDDPVVDFTATPTAGDAPLLVQFDASDSHDPDDDPLTFFWQFGDGESATTAAVNHTFQQAGEYTTLVEISDNRGGAAIDSVIITVNPNNQVTNLISNGTFEQDLNGWSTWTERGALNLSVQNGQAHISSSNHNGGLYQQFNTGGAGTEIYISGFWASAPTLADAQWGEVLIVNSDRLPQNGEDLTGLESDVELIYKNDTFANKSGWSGNLSQTSLLSTTGSFVAAGDVATIVLKSGNIAGALTGLKVDNILVEPASSNPGNHHPIASISAAPVSGNAPLTVSFDASESSDPDGDALTVHWDFGDGNQSTELVTDHTFSEPGAYNVVLTVHDGNGLSHSKSITINAYDPANPPDDWDLVLEEYWDTMDGDDWYDQNVVQQVRNGWTLWNNSGHNPIGNPNGDEPWNDWGMSETRFGWDAFLPPHEWDLFLNERGFCYKIFAGYRAWHIELSSPSISLSPGTYRATLHYHCDSYVDYQDGKIPPGWTEAFQARVNLANQEGEWQNADYLSDNTVIKEFYLGQSGDYQVSFEMRNPWAIQNGCAFCKYFTLEKSTVQNTVPLTYDFSQPGWYMISVPGNMDDMTVSSLFPDAQDGTALYYYIEDNDYLEVQTLEPGKAYWIYIQQPVSYSFDVAPVQHIFYHFNSPGWYMVGCLIDGIDYNNIVVDPADGVVTPFLAYNNENFTYTPSSQVDATTGYWVSVLKECDLEIHSGASLGKTAATATPAWFAEKYGKLPPPPPAKPVAAAAPQHPEGFCLYQNYPNPFNPETRVEYDLPQSQWTTLEIFNLKGKRINTLVNGFKRKGHHSIIWNARNQNGMRVASGIYWLVLRSGTHSAVQKMILLK